MNEQGMIGQQQSLEIITNSLAMMTAQIPTTIFSQNVNNQINPNDNFFSAISTNQTNDLLVIGADTSMDVNENNMNANVVGTSEGQRLLDDMFGQYNNEQSNNGFKALDNVFF